MRSRDHMQQDELAPKTPTPEQAHRGPLELAGQIGNSNMQRVAGSPALQRSPAAAGLIQRSSLARKSEDDGGEAEATPDAEVEAPVDMATPDAEVEAPAATPDAGVEKLGEENVPETPAAADVEKHVEAPPPPAGPMGIADKGPEGMPEPAGVEKEAGSEVKDEEEAA